MEVSSRHIQFWEDTARELTALVCGQVGGVGLDAFALKYNPFEFRKDSGEMPFILRWEQIQDIFQNGVLFEVLVAVLNREARAAWPERYLEGVCLLDEAGRPLSPRMEAENIYFAACEVLITRYSDMSGIPLNHVALLAAMAYEKSDFKPGTQIYFGVQCPTAFRTEMGDGSKDAVFNEKSLRTVRKLLSGVKKDENALYFREYHSGDVREYRCEGYVKKSVPVAFRITFYGGEKWGFRVGNAKHDLFTAKNRQIQCFDAAFHGTLYRLEEEFRGHCPDFVSGGLRKFLDAAREQTHGTSVVFVSFSAFPAARERFKALEAAGRARSVQDGGGEKNDGFYRAVTELARIDGSLVVDVDINDYRFAYFSVILDGRVGLSAKGWASSGARANSVLTFVGDLLRSELEKAAEELAREMLSRKELARRLCAGRIPIAAVIFSEDGYVTPVLGGELAEDLYGEAADKAMSKL